MLTGGGITCSAASSASASASITAYGSSSALEVRYGSTSTLLLFFLLVSDCLVPRSNHAWASLATSKCASIVCGLLFWLGVEADFCAGAGVVGVVLVLVVLGGVEAVGAVGRGRRPGVGIGVGVACGNGGIGIGMLGMPDMQDDMPGMPGVMGVEDIGRGGGGMGIGGMGGIIGGIDEPITGANGLGFKVMGTAVGTREAKAAGTPALRAVLEPVLALALLVPGGRAFGSRMNGDFGMEDLGVVPRSPSSMSGEVDSEISGKLPGA